MSKGKVKGKKVTMRGVTDAHLRAAFTSIGRTLDDHAARINGQADVINAMRPLLAWALTELGHPAASPSAASASTPDATGHSSPDAADAA